MLSRILKTTLGAAVLFGAMTFNAEARNYNEGFLAAESGDFNTAVQQWGPLADQGHPIAQFNMALLYHSGLGVDLNEAAALEWYKKSAKNGYYKAQEYMAVGYREGWFGLPKDSRQAEYWEKQLEENVR
ncbi:MAG: hypothetical protein L0Z73_15770 [Gammaproteobacteria bacterium]|nr:hypothetical protein [Gammaproteobacteria bacterium]